MLRWSHGSEVIRADTATVATFVVNMMTSRDRPTEQLKESPMRQIGFPPEEMLSVTEILPGSPFPATVTNRELVGNPVEDFHQFNSLSMQMQVPFQTPTSSSNSMGRHS